MMTVIPSQHKIKGEGRREDKHISLDSSSSLSITLGKEVLSISQSIMATICPPKQPTRNALLYGLMIFGVIAQIALCAFYNRGIFLGRNIATFAAGAPRPSNMIEDKGRATLSEPSFYNQITPTKTMIVMADSRSLDDDDYHKLAFTINSHYAQLHGYAIRYVHTPCLTEIADDGEYGFELATKKCMACIHPRYGGRAPPWCKILAISETMHRYKDAGIDQIIYIDSDAFVNKLNETIHNKKGYFKKTLNMFRQVGETIHCSGIQLWKNTDIGRDMTQAWWDSSESLYFNYNHDYEQSVVRTRSKILQPYPAEIHRIIESVREYDTPHYTGFFRHITYKQNMTRTNRMEEFMKVNGIKPLSKEKVASIQREDDLFTTLRVATSDNS
jgi:hypothetical protein